MYGVKQTSLTPVNDIYAHRESTEDRRRILIQRFDHAYRDRFKI